MKRRWTEFQLSDIPRDTRQILADRARRATVERYQAPAEMFEEAEAMVAAGHVVLSTRNMGLVYDAATERLGGGWLSVSSAYCAHCDDAHAPIVCRHKLAVWYADLLARHLPDEEAAGGQAETAATTAPAARGRATLGRSHSASIGGPALRRPRSGNGRNCPHCGGFLTASGGCNKATCPTNRGGGR